jgi:hypothetical protein
MTEPNLNNAAPETSKPQAESQPPQNEPEEKKPEPEPPQEKSEKEPEERKPESQLTPCPPKSSSPELDDKSCWKEYPSETGKDLFHGGQKVYLENIKPTPQRPQQECVYDKQTGELVTKDHPFGGIRGTPNEYDGHGSLKDAYHHTVSDKGGIVQSGGEALRDSMALHGSNLRDYLENKMEKLGLSEEKSGSSLPSQIETSRELERQRERE